MLGFCGDCCATAGVLTSPDSGINIDAPSNAAQDRLRQPDALLGGLAAEDGSSLKLESNMASLSLFMMRQWLLA
jgi:hypothetical protein